MLLGLMVLYFFAEVDRVAFIHPYPNPSFSVTP
jgi:hypothetical protein